jgi:hypothetical protein
VARRPGVPEELHGLAGDDGDVGFARLAGLVADYVRGLIAVRRDLGAVLTDASSRHISFYWEAYEARVKGCRAPPSDSGRVRLVVVVEVPARVELPTGFDEVDETVSRSLGHKLD